MVNKESQTIAHLFRATDMQVEAPPFDAAWLTQQPTVLLEPHIMESAKPSSNRKLTLVLGAAASVLLAVGAAFILLQKREVPSKASKGIVIFVSGQAEIERAGKTTPIQSGDVVLPADRIRTTTGHVDLHLADQSILRIRENADVTFEKLARTTGGDPALGIGLKSGRVLNMIPKIGKEGSYNIMTPTAIASVRGTSFDASVDRETSSIVVIEGKVEVEEKVGSKKTYVLEANDRVTVGEKSEKQRDPGLADKSRPEYAEMQQHLEQFSPAVRQAVMGLAEAKTEDDLRKIYNQEIELIQLKSGRTLRGVVVSQMDGQLIIQSTDGSYVVNELDVLKIQYVR